MLNAISILKGEIHKTNTGCLSVGNAQHMDAESKFNYPYMKKNVILIIKTYKGKDVHLHVYTILEIKL